MPGSVGAIIAQFKYITTIKINQVLEVQGKRVWQRDFYDRVIRDEPELNNTRQYIQTNPAQSTADHDNLANFGRHSS